MYYTQILFNIGNEKSFILATIYKFEDKFMQI